MLKDTEAFNVTDQNNAYFLYFTPSSPPPPVKTNVNLLIKPDPKVVGVEVLMLGDVLEILLVLLGALGRFPEDQLTVGTTLG